MLALGGDTSIGRGWGGGAGRGRSQLCVRKAISGAKASWPYRENPQGLEFPLSWFPTCLQRTGCCKEHKQNSWPESWPGRGALRQVAEREQHWILTGGWLLQGTSLALGLAPRGTGEKYFLVHTPGLPPPLARPCPSRRCARPALVVGSGGRRVAFLHASLAFNLGHRHFKRLIKMPGPQGTLTHTSTFVCIMKAEQLLDAVIRDNVLKTKIYK